MRLCEHLLNHRTPPERFTRHPRPRQCRVLSSLCFENVRIIFRLRQLSSGPPVSCLESEIKPPHYFPSQNASQMLKHPENLAGGVMSIRRCSCFFWEMHYCPQQLTPPVDGILTPTRGILSIWEGQRLLFWHSTNLWISIKGTCI